MYTDISYIKEHTRILQTRLSEIDNEVEKWVSAYNLPPRIPNSENSEFVALKLNSGTVVTGYYSFKDCGYITHHIVDGIEDLKFVKEWSLI